MPRYRFADFTLSPRRRRLLQGGHERPLIPRYFDLLVFLIERRHEAVHRQDIFDRVWKDVTVSDSALSQAIRTIRQTLGDATHEPRFIRTVSRHGYQFVFTDLVEEEDDDETTARGPVSRLQRVVGALSGGGAAGVLSGAIGGLLLALAPGSTAPIAVAPVLAFIGGCCGAIGGAGVGAGLSLAELWAATRAAPTQISRSQLALVAGAAVGGGLVGFAVQLLARWSLAALVGVQVDVGGGLEGLVIGAAAGLGYAAAPKPGEGGRLNAAFLVAAACGLAALGVTLTGRPLVAGTIHAIAQASQGSQVLLTPLGALLGEPDFGPVSRAVIGAGEGVTFGLGLAFGLARRA